MAVNELLCSTSNPANGTAATTGNTGFLALSTAAGGSKTFDSTVGINSNTGLAIVDVAGTNQARTNTFTATADLELTFTFKTPSSNPGAAITFTAFRWASGVAFRFNWNTNGSFGLFDNGSVNNSITGSGVMSLATNYTIKSSFHVATSTTGVVTVQVFNAAGTQVGSTFTSTTANLGTNNLTQIDFDPNNQSDQYGISEIRYDPTTSGSLLAAWAPVSITVNAVPAQSAYSTVAAPTVGVATGANPPAVRAAGHVVAPAVSITGGVTVNAVPVTAGAISSTPPVVSASNGTGLIQYLCSISNPANGTAATTGNTGFLALTTASGGSKTFDSAVGINSNTGLAIVNAAGTNQLRTQTFTATQVGRLTFTLKTPSSNPASATCFVNFRHASGVAFRLQWYSNGRIGLFDNANNTTYFTGTGIISNGSLSANYSIQINFTVATPTTGSINFALLDSSGTQVGSTFSIPNANLGTNPVVQMDFDQDSQAGQYGISEIQFDPSTNQGLIAPWFNSTASTNGVPAIAQASAIAPVVTAETTVSGTTVPMAQAVRVLAPSVTIGMVVKPSPAQAIGNIPDPTVSSSTDATVTAPAVKSSVFAPAPRLLLDAVMFAVPATAVASVPAPLPSISSVVILAQPISTLARASAPSLNVDSTIFAMVAKAHGRATSPALSIGSTAFVIPATATGGVISPQASASGNTVVLAVPAYALARIQSALVSSGGSVVYVWNGANLIPADISVWNGSSLIPATIEKVV